MNFSSRKYNIVLSVMIILIGLAYLVNACFINENIFNNNTMDTTIEVDPYESDENVDIIDDTKENATPLVFSNGYDAIDYGLNIINKAKIPFLYEFYNNTSSANAVNVKAYEQVYRYKNHDFMLIWTNTDISIPMAKSIFKKGNFFRAAYSNCETVYNRYIYDTSRYNRTAKTYTLSNSDTFIGDPKISGFNITDKTKLWANFYLTVNRSTSKIIYFDKSNSESYIVKVAMLNDKMLKTDEYIAAYLNSSYVKSIKFDYLHLTFTINKKSGRITKIVREDCYNLGTNVAGLSFSCTGSATHLYTYMQTEKKIKDLSKNLLNLNLD